MRSGFDVICGLALLIVAATGAGAAVQARDFEMGGDGLTTYSVATPTPTTHHPATAASRPRRVKPHPVAKPVVER